MKTVLMVTPQFPPASGAATHRVRLLAPHLVEFGWNPVVATCDAESYDGPVDTDLLALVPGDLEVHRFQAIRPRSARRLGVGDLGLRAGMALARGCTALMTGRRFEAVFVTLPPNYTALLGAHLGVRFEVPFVLDYQDPWVGAWGLNAGGGPNGRVDAKSRLSRALALLLEPRAVEGMAGLTAVSEGTWSGLLKRNPQLEQVPKCEIPFGFDPADFAAAGKRRPSRRGSEAGPEEIWLGFVGTIAPLADDVVRAYLSAVASFRRSGGETGRRLRLKFVGTSGQTTGSPAPRLEPLSSLLGLDDVVEERPLRVDYLSALRALLDADVLVLLGSSEAHYTASRLGQTLWAGKPILAFFHEESPVSRDLGRAAERSERIRLVTYGRSRRPSEAVNDLEAALRALVADVRPWPEPHDGLSELAERLHAREQSQALARLLDATCKEGDPAR